MMSKLIDYLAKFVVVVSWLIGIVLAKGGWETFFTIIFVPYSLYKVVEQIMVHTGFGF